MTRILCALLLLSACAAPRATDTPAADPRSTARAGDPPPEFAQSKGGLKKPITSNDYGAFAGAPNAPQLGDPAPDFEGALVDGGKFSLAQARQAGPVLVMFYRGFW